MSSTSKGIFLALSLATASCFAAETAELGSLRGKAIQGNAVAQYNLGRIFADTKSPSFDRAEAFVWFKLAAEGGSTGQDLARLLEEMTPAELGEGRRRLEERRSQIKSSREIVAGMSIPDTSTGDALAKLAAERDRLAVALNSASSEIAELRAAQAKQSQSETAEKLASDLARMEGELNETRATARQMAVRNQQLEDVAAERGRAMSALRSEVAAAKAVAEKASQAGQDSRLKALETEKAFVEKQLGEAQVRLRVVAELSEKLERSERDALVLRNQNDKLLQDLRRAEQAHEDKQAAQSGEQAGKLATVLAQLDQEKARVQIAEGKLLALAEEHEKLKLAAPAKSDEEAVLRERIVALEKQVQAQTDRAVAAETKLTAAPAEAALAEGAPDTASLQRQLAETESKLSMSLRSYSLLQQELDQVKSVGAESSAGLQAKLAAASSEISSLKGQILGLTADLQERNNALVAAQQELGQLRQSGINLGIEATALRDQLRQTQSQLALVVEENRDYRTKMAVSSPSPSSSMSVPTRPSSVQVQVAAPSSQGMVQVPAGATTSRATVAAAPAASASSVGISLPSNIKPAAVRTHVIGEGDTLSRISKRYYGTTERWKEIFDANPNLLSDPNRLPRGASLRIP